MGKLENSVYKVLDLKRLVGASRAAEASLDHCCSAQNHRDHVAPHLRKLRV